MLLTSARADAVIRAMRSNGPSRLQFMISWELTSPGLFAPASLTHLRQVHLHSGSLGRTVWAQSRQMNRPSL